MPVISLKIIIFRQNHCQTVCIEKTNILVYNIIVSNQEFIWKSAWNLILRLFSTLFFILKSQTLYSCVSHVNIVAMMGITISAPITRLSFDTCLKGLALLRWSGELFEWPYPPKFWNYPHLGGNVEFCLFFISYLQ